MLKYTILLSVCCRKFSSVDKCVKSVTISRECSSTASYHHWINIHSALHCACQSRSKGKLLLLLLLLLLCFITPYWQQDRTIQLNTHTYTRMHPLKTLQSKKNSKRHIPKAHLDISFRLTADFLYGFTPRSDEPYARILRSSWKRIVAGRSWRS